MPGSMIRRFGTTAGLLLGILSSWMIPTSQAVAADPVTVTGGAAYGVGQCGTGCMRLIVGRQGSDYLTGGSCNLHTDTVIARVDRPDRISQVKLVLANYDDYMRVRMNGNIVWNSRPAWTGTGPNCGNGGNHNTTLDQDVTSWFANTPRGSELEIRNEISHDSKGEGWTEYRIYYAISACDDGIDNDGDGRTDYPSDTGCSSADDATETWDTIRGTPCPGCYCGADLNGNGDMSESGEVKACDQLTDFTAQCPLQRRTCVAEDGGYVCPTDRSLACQNTGSGAPTCSPNMCSNSGGSGVVEEDVDQPEPQNNGPTDANGNCLGVLRLFPGQGMRCRRSGSQTAFQNCCSNKNGKLADTMGEKGGKTQREYKTEANSFAVWDNQCDIQDQKAAQLADSGYCISLGTYCAEKWTFGCVQRAQGYCCFNSKLSKMIQEQGRAQLPSMGSFGSAKNPQCRGFTLQEFQSLDFSKIDLSGYYADFRTQSQGMMQSNTQDNVHENTGR